MWSASTRTSYAYTTPSDMKTLAPGQGEHLGGPWWIMASPDTGRVEYGFDRGPSVLPVPLYVVPAEIKAKARRLLSNAR